MSLLPSFARMTIWFIPWADPLLQTMLESPPAPEAEEAAPPRERQERAPIRREACAR